MDVEDLRSVSQVNDNCNDNISLNKEYYSNNKEVYGLDRQEPDLSLLTPCEFCNRTFVPASLNKHRRGCYKAWLKQKDRDSRMDREKNKYQTPVGYNGEKPILTIEQMLAKRRQRRLNWRLRHEEFMRAVHAAREYADAVASGNPLPPPPPAVIEPDLKQCPHCQRRFHDKAIERHLSRCKEQSIRNNKERPSYQTMEAKRRLAVRLYYQPSSRPNSCLSMTNPPTPTSFSRPSSRQTDFEFNMNSESPNDLNNDRYSSMSASENKETRNKIPSAMFDNITKMHGRSISRKSMRDFRASQNTTPTFDSRNSTPLLPDNYQSGRQSNMSTLSSRNSGRQSMVATPVESQFSSRLRSNLTKNADIYNPCGNLRRSTSCVSQLRNPSVCKSERIRIENPARGDVMSQGRKPFSCGRSTSKESVKQRDGLKQATRPDIAIMTGFKLPERNAKSVMEGVRHKSLCRTEKTLSPMVKSQTSTVDLEKLLSCRSEKIRIPSNKVQTLTAHSDKKDVDRQKVLRSEHVHSHRSKRSSTSLTDKVMLPLEKSDAIKVISDLVMPPKKSRHRSKIVISDGDANSSKSSKPAKIYTEKIDILNKEKHSESHSSHKIRNEVQIRIKTHATPDNSAIKEGHDDSSKLSNSQIHLKTPILVSGKESHKSNILTVKENDVMLAIKSHTEVREDRVKSKHESKRLLTSCKAGSDKGSTTFKQLETKDVIVKTKHESKRIVTNSNTGSDNVQTLYKQAESTGDVTKNKQEIKTFVSNCNLMKAQGDSSVIQPQMKSVSPKDDSGNGKCVTKNLYQCRSIRSVSISDQNNATKYRSSISLQDSLCRGEDTNVNRVVKTKEIAVFCQDCGHKFPNRDAKFCCSCGCRRVEIPANKGQ